MARFQPAEPQWTPLANWDERAAWAAERLRVEAAAWRGRPVSFRIVGPWTVPGRGGMPAGAGQIAQVALVYSALAAACVLAWLHLRARKADLRGATKLAAWCWAAFAGSGFLHLHHVGAIDELNTFWKVVTGTAAVNGLVVWVFYLALEPWVRRRWPQTMISWSRYAVKGLRDPLVGRDLLYSVGIGALLKVIDLLHSAVRGAAAPPMFPDLSALLGVSAVTSRVLNLFANDLTGLLLLFFLLFVLRVLLRKEWVAMIAVTAIIASLSIAQAGAGWQWLDVLFAVAGVMVMATAVLRFGLIAAIVGYAIGDILDLPHTLDFSAWYAGTVAVPLLLLALLAVYGFRTSLGGRRLIPLPD